MAPSWSPGGTRNYCTRARATPPSTACNCRSRSCRSRRLPPDPRKTPMPDYVISPPPQSVIAVAGATKLFPVRRIWCVGRNYVEHIREMGQDERKPPFFFAKPADAIVPDGGVIPYPPLTNDLHHEVELVVALKSGGLRVSA